MGRPIKTAKLQGSTPVDSGYNNPAGSGNTYSVVGGNTGTTGKQILCQVKLPRQSAGPGYIIRQKGARKFLAATVASVQDEDIVQGETYVITLLGTTNWQALGASATAAVGDVFTAKIDGTGLTTTGQVNQCGICVLVNLATPTVDNTMSIKATDVNATDFYLSKISKTYGIDFANPANAYMLSFNAAAAADPGNGQPLQVVTVESL